MDVLLRLRRIEGGMADAAAVRVAALKSRAGYAIVEGGRRAGAGKPRARAGGTH